MEKEVLKSNNGHTSGSTTTTNHHNNHHHRERLGLGIGGGDGLLSSSRSLPETRSTTSSDFGLQWGNRKRLRCMKIQVKDDSVPVHRTTARIDRRVVRSDKDSLSQPSTAANNSNGGYFNLRQRPSSSPPPPPPQRILRNSETMRGQSNGVGGEQKAHDKKGSNNNHYNHHHHHNSNNHNDNNVGGGGGGGGASGASSETAHDSKKGGSSSGSEAIPPVWPPKFAIALTNKEKEEDFMAIKGSKLPQRPKKRAKFIQRTLNLVSPGAWLCDLTLERYEVREKKISKKRPRGLKAMGNMESDSE